MDKGYEKEGFQTLKIKASVVQKFRSYSRGIGKSQSITLLLMLEFFEYNNVSPKETLGPRMQTLEQSLKKRINAIIAIIRDIEKQQTIPTKAMLEALFEELPGQQSKKTINSFQEAFKNLNIGSSARPPTPPEIDHKDIRRLLTNIESVQPTFGKAFLKINLSLQEVNKLKSKYHVYHD